MTVKTTLGLLAGMEEKDCVRYLGVPYAKPPVGSLRFEAPQPAEPWEGVREAFAPGPRCPQTGASPGGFYHKEFYDHPLTAQSEDCLYLNVWTPRHARRCPIAVWIHGGAFCGGSGDGIEFDGAAFARRGVILVTLNYRLGLLGFLAHPELGPDRGTYGLLDQLAALRFVKANARAFGGDPRNITVFGQSAGAMSVQALCQLPETKGLIRRAILQSGAGYKGFLTMERTLRQAEETAAEFFRREGLTVEKLRALPAEELAPMADRYSALSEARGDGMLPLSPPASDGLLKYTADGALERGKLLRIPYLVGSTADDILPEGAEPHPMARGAEGFARLQGRRSRVYLYSFRRKLPGDGAGAFHSSELWYVFGTLERCWRPFSEEDRALSERMTDAWCAFMRNGRPGWDPFDPDEPDSLKIWNI